MNSLESARQFLLDLDRGDLAGLLEFSVYRRVEYDDGLLGTNTFVEVISPTVYANALASLLEHDKKRILESIKSIDAGLSDVWPSGDRLIFSSNNSIELDPVQALLGELVCQRNTMIEVAVGSTQINDVNDYYRARYRKIRRILQARQIEDPNPHEDLWSWYRKWKEEFPTYVERRRYVNNLLNPLIRGLAKRRIEPSPAREPTGWEKVDRALEKARHRLSQATNEEDFQAIGLLCREVLISLGQAVYNSEVHESPDGVEPSETDARRLLESFLASTVPGETNETVRRHTKAAISLALDLQHRRTATFRLAAMCLEATSSSVNVIAILSGRRDPPAESSAL